MESPILQFIVLIILSSFCISLQALDPPLTLDYYSSSCPSVLELVRKEMECVVLSDPRNAALILRLHFHDCFVQGCDGSVLLDDTLTLKGEKTASPNINSLKGFELVDRIKNMVESECPGVVSCADILTIAARDAVILVGGPYWDVPLGRKDSRTAGYDLASANLPSENDGLLTIISKFHYQGLSVTDMVALAGNYAAMAKPIYDYAEGICITGAHTIGVARCENYRARIYGNFPVTSATNPHSETYLSNLKSTCPAIGGDNNVAALDYVTPNIFDNSFYQILLGGEGLMNSDQDLYSSMFGIETKELVKQYAADPHAFFERFSYSMVKMGNITNSETFVNGEVRKNCRYVNI